MFCQRRARYGGMEATEAKRLKALETENVKLKNDDRNPPVPDSKNAALSAAIIDIAQPRRRFGDRHLSDCCVLPSPR
ncbi:hypothetical protein CAGGBEG34_200057 [Candidatus Glomeribacter gigasporarum BEG34]|uniref:Transposase n=1 Tax=Candidatus Glomeribacter gigasporarum BEG34 TaxID=1070319 RepID=G2J8G0_9BURK|nr:hypothetical protein CAGGBEG34_200057 [Candidatus Glomeribacter gigasporarum BEG34]